MHCELVIRSSARLVWSSAGQGGVPAGADAPAEDESEVVKP